jgi:hypothetical protein
MNFAARRLFTWPLMIIAAIVLPVEVWILQKLDYSKGWLERVGLIEALNPQERLSLGNLRWDPAPYVGSPQLATFAAMVHEHCPNMDALPTTRCLSDFLASRFPHGSPSRQIFDENFVPAEVLQRHLQGEPGHCVSRSGIMAAALLASGVPARIVQLLSNTRRDQGHNALEVFDPSVGWVFFDPSFGGELQTSTGGRSAAALLSAGGQFRWIQSAKVAPLSDWQRFYAGPRAAMFKGHVVYPEPWLYTRVGSKTAPPPFQARYLVVGPPSWRLAFGRKFLLAAILSTFAALLVAGTSLIFPVIRRLALRRKPERWTDKPPLELSDFDG